MRENTEAVAQSPSGATFIEAGPVAVDLFSGCGGFSRGAHEAGLDVIAAYDIDPILSSSYAFNFPNTKFVLRDISTLRGSEIFSECTRRIDCIFGGPPCQGFSSIGRRDPADPRRSLLSHFFRVVSEVRPLFFVMENVPGLMQGAALDVLESAMSLVANDYNLLGPVILDASQFGAATRRPRLFLIGTRADASFSVSLEDLKAQVRPYATVRSAIGDLVGATYIAEEDNFDVWRIDGRRRPNSYAEALRSHDRLFTGHRATTHTAEVARRFKQVMPGTVDKIGRHPRLAWEGLCPTLRAGTGSDRGSYQSVRPIHPEEPRVITVREAARLQGFPDWHRFHPTVWHSFRMIGNSVSPLMSRAIFTAIRQKMKGCSSSHSRPRSKEQYGSAVA